jgi:hypothetical protein
LSSFYINYAHFKNPKIKGGGLTIDVSLFESVGTRVSAVRPPTPLDTAYCTFEIAMRAGEDPGALFTKILTIKMKILKYCNAYTFVQLCIL